LKISIIRATIVILGALFISACTARLAAMPVPTPTRIPNPTAAVVVVLQTAQKTPTPQTTATHTPEPTITPTPTITTTPTPAPTATRYIPPTVAPTITPTPAVIAVMLSPFTPPELRGAFDQLVQTGRYAYTDNVSNALLSLLPADQGLITWVYVPAVAFPTLADDITWENIQKFWKGDANALAYLSENLSGNLKNPTLIISQDVFDWLKSRLGAPADALPVQIVAPADVAPTVWKARPAAWTIQPFNRLDPSLKALTVNGASLFSPAFAANNYPLVQRFNLSGASGIPENTLPQLLKTGGFTINNRDPEKLTTLVMTGVTALTRATAWTMERTGIELPARDIAPFLTDSHIVHTSNEVAFAKNCPAPSPSSSVMTFCSREKYFALLEKIKVKIIELTGNHVNDWGRPALANSLDLYDEKGVLTFGGGRNLADAKDALTVAHHSNNFAFIGCNPVGPAYAWAKEDEPGSAPCDLPYMEQEIKRLKTLDYIVIVTLQYNEYYEYAPPPDQVKYFGQFATWGADLVMGSQAHVPQGFGFVEKTFIHYGVGNLFFDQMDYTTTRQMFADKLAFYEGRLIGAQLFTGLIEDYSRPRPMTPKERNQFLWAIFRASGWMGN
jgi:hypothetical protein